MKNFNEYVGKFAFDDEQCPIPINFLNKPIIVGYDFSYLDHLTEQVEIESDIDPEEKITNSWYHRARLGDENREIYDDYMDTDFEEVELYMNMLFEQEKDEFLNLDQNSQILEL